MDAEEAARKKADDKYFTQRKAGPRPSSQQADQEELVTFVEDGLNRGAKVRSTGYAKRHPSSHPSITPPQSKSKSKSGNPNQP
mmetsp:Transcript_57559/g.130428  ORF Transcript_57559/g.130428 Transcript_57559/m.130428 type:complete len:83 (-) Transcript_57559:17-265(-)